MTDTQLAIPATGLLGALARQRVLSRCRPARLLSRCRPARLRSPPTAPPATAGAAGRAALQPCFSGLRLCGAASAATAGAGHPAVPSAVVPAIVQPGPRAKPRRAVLALDLEFTHVELPDGKRASLASWLCCVDRFGEVVLQTNIALPPTCAAPDADAGSPTAALERPAGTSSDSSDTDADGGVGVGVQLHAGRGRLLCCLPPGTRVVGGVPAKDLAGAPPLRDVRAALLAVLRGTDTMNRATGSDVGGTSTTTTTSNPGGSSGPGDTDGSTSASITTANSTSTSTSTTTTSNGACGMLVGHGLTKDLAALGVQPARDLLPYGVRTYDTMSHGKFQGGRRRGGKGGTGGGGARPLAVLAAELLGRTIQRPGRRHDPREDAAAVMELYVRYVDYELMVEHQTARLLAQVAERAAASGDAEQQQQQQQQQHDK